MPYLAPAIFRIAEAIGADCRRLPVLVLSMMIERASDSSASSHAVCGRIRMVKVLRPSGPGWNPG